MFNKLKNILFEEETVEIPVIKEDVQEKKEEIKEDVEPTIESRFSRNNFEVSEEEKPTVEIKEEVKEDAPRMVLPEESFEEKPSPFQQFDEEEFDRLAALNKNRLLERDRKLREEKAKSMNNIALEAPKEEVVENKTDRKFTPSPVISPVYGILDKNYKKEDIMPKEEVDNPTLALDVDSVRKRAFGALEDIEKKAAKSDSSLDNVKITSFDDEDNVKEEKTIEETIDEIPELEDTAPIETISSDVEDSTMEEVQEEISNNDDITPDLDNTLESDLFNLIDSMYSDKEEE